MTFNGLPFFFPVIIFALLDQDNLERFKEGVKAESGDDTRKLLYFERLIVCVCARGMDHDSSDLPFLDIELLNT